MKPGSGIAGSVALAALLLSSNTFHNGFVVDDQVHVLTDPRVTRISLGEAFSTGWWWGQDDSRLYRPVARLLLSLEHAAFGFDPRGFHAVSVLLHAACAFLVARLAFHLSGRVAAVAAGLLFAAHPVHAEAVSPVVGVADLLSACLGLASVIAYLRWLGSGRRLDLALALLGVTAAIFSKESGAVFALAPVFLDRVCSFESRNEALRRFPRRLRVYALFLVPVVVFLAARWAVLGIHGSWSPPIAPLEPDPDSRAFPLEHLSWAPRFFTALRILARNSLVLAFPMRLSSWYGFDEIPEARGLIEPAVVAGAVLLAAYLVSLWFSARRPGPAFLALAWMGVAYLPASHFIVPVGVYLAERLLYVPSVGLSLLLGTALARAHRRWLVPLAVLGSVGLTLLAVRTVTRNAELRDGLSLWRASVRGTPRSSLAHAALSEQLYERGLKLEADEAARRALAINPDSYKALNTMGMVATDLKRHGEAEQLLRRAMTVNQRMPEARFNLGRCLHEQARYREAASGFGGALERNPSLPLYREWFTINDALQAWKEGELERAARVLEEARSSFPTSGIAPFYLGRLNHARGRWKEAVQSLTEAVAREPGNVLYRNTLTEVQRSSKP